MENNTAVAVKINSSVFGVLTITYDLCS